MKIELPEGEEFYLFRDDLTNTVLGSYMSERKKRGLSICTESQIIYAIISYVFNRLESDYRLDKEQTNKHQLRKETK